MRGLAFTKWAAGLIVVFCAVPVAAQSTANQPAPPTSYNLDQNGVDIVTGAFYFTSVDVSIGGANGGLQYNRSTRNLGYDDDFTSNALNSNGTTITVSIGAISDLFAVGASKSQRGTGATLTSAGGTYTYTTSSGVAYQFDPAYVSDRFRLAQQRLASITWPDGRKLTLEYDTRFGQLCIADGCEQFYTSRVNAVASNDGYRLTFAYLRSNIPSIGATDKQGAEWMTVQTVLASNAAVQYCTPTTCSGVTWPTVTYVWNTAGTLETRTDAEGRKTTVGYDGLGRVISVRRSSTAEATLGYDAAGRVATFTVGGSTWNYAYADNGTTRTTTITNAVAPTRVVVSNTATLKVTSDKTGTAAAVAYRYDTQTRLDQITYPEGNKVEYVYDNGTSSGRGNVTTTRLLPKSGAGAITTTATFPADAQCASLGAAVCNQPTITTDARGAVTNYEYEAFGAVKKVTLPTPKIGVVRPETRFTYQPLYAWYLNSSGSMVQAATPIQRPIATSSCATGTAPACVGTADETVSETGYGASGVANNLLPRIMTQRSGNLSGGGAVASTTSMNYDAIGNTIEVDGPLPGPDDIVFSRYDRNRALSGTIGPDPDGTGAMKRRATQIIRNVTTGLVETVEAGTVAGTPSPDWATFISLQRVEIGYDPTTYLKTLERALAGSTLYQLTQYSYDGAFRPKCTATRIGLASAANVCQQLNNAEGYDQIAETVYGSDGRVATQRTNLTDTARYTYSLNGQVKTLTDANSNVTTYDYDLYDRSERITYPGGSYESVGYDAAGNVTSERRRNAATVANVYDALNRLDTRTPSMSGDTAPVAFTYDSFSRPTRVQATGTGAWSSDQTFGYDALSRLTTQTAKRPGSIDHTMTMLYDPAGRRTRLTWWDGFYVDYDYLLTNEMLRVRENGATSGIGVLATYGYDDLGRRISLSRGNGTSTTWTPDGFSRLASMVDRIGGTARDQTVTYTYNPVSQLRTRRTTNDAYSYSGYQPEAKSYTPNALNQITNVSGTPLSYDTNGNLTVDDRGNAYSYNLDNQLTGKTGTATLAYDPLGRLALLTPAVGAIRFDYDGSDMVAESETGGNLLRRYVHGPGVDEPLVWYEGTGTTQRRWLGADERGSITWVTADNGAPLAINSYDEYGVPGRGNTGRFGYTGQAWLAEIGVAYYKARMYDPVLGRFLQSDPIRYAGGMNLYAYVGGDPVNYSDPSGLACEPATGTRLCGHLPPGQFAVYRQNPDHARDRSEASKAISDADANGDGRIDEAERAAAGSFVQSLISGFEALQKGDIVVTGQRPQSVVEVGDIIVTARRQLRQANNRVEGSLDATFHILSSAFIGTACSAVRDAPCTLSEQLAIDSARGSYRVRHIMQGKINDPRYPGNVWGKFQYVHHTLLGRKIIVHFWRNLQTGAEEGFKIKR